MRYRDRSNMGSVMVDRCVARGPERRCQQIPEHPEFAYPIRLRKVGLPCHFSAVAASNEANLRTPNAAVTKNSTVMGRGFRCLAAGRACAAAHVTTPLRSLVTRAASERGKVGASFHSSRHSLAIYLSCVRDPRRSLWRSSKHVAACGADWCRAQHQPVPHSVSRPSRYQPAQNRYQTGHKRYQSAQHAIIVSPRAHASPFSPPQEIWRSPCRLLHSAV